jgi:hypothetical protein
MSGVTEVRLHRNIVSTVSTNSTNVIAVVLNSSTKDHATGVKRYLDGVATVDGRHCDNVSYFWVELIYARGNRSGPQAIKSHTTKSSPVTSWEFYEDVFPSNNQFGPVLLSFKSIRCYQNEIDHERRLE